MQPDGSLMIRASGAEIERKPGPQLPLREARVDTWIGSQLSRAMCAAAVVACLSAAPARAQASSSVSDGVVKIAIVADMSGTTADWSGQGAIEAVRMAIEDFGKTVLGAPIEMISFDHQHKTDVAAAKARELLDTGKVDMILNLSNSSIALAVMEIGRTKKKITIVTGSGSSQITNANCSPYNVHYVFNSDALANAVTAPLVRAGLKNWYLLVSDFAYGLSLEKTVTNIVTAEGGKVIGTVRHPAYTASDFSSYALQAQSSGAQVIGLSNSSSDTVNSIKSLNEFGIMGSKQKVVAYTMIINDVHSLGLSTAKGLQFASAFYWDRTDETRAWSKRFFDRMKRMPNMVNAGDYSAVTHYLKAVRAAGTDEADAVMAKMRETPVDDVFAKGARIREDGLLAHDYYLMEVKDPAESKQPWDYLHVRAAIPAETANPPLSASSCALVKR